MPDELTARPARYGLAHELYGRALGAVTLLAWMSLHVQLTDLFGERGIVPMSLRLSALLDRDGAGAMLSSPSVLFVVGGSSASMHAVALLGEVSAIAMTLGLLPGPAALLSFVLYLSFVSVGWPFIPLQWDSLLLEALVIAALLGRWRRWRPDAIGAEPSTSGIVVGASLVTRLFFASGLVKILSGDPTWRDGTAMTFHHWTQPLPGPLAPLLHAMPTSMHVVETYATVLLEVGAPLLVFAGVRGRRAFAAIVVVLMFLIGASGNYGFFNLLTVVLCIPLLDDAALSRLLPMRLRLPPAPVPVAAPVRVVMGTYVTWAAIQLLTSLGTPVPSALEGGYVALNRLHIAGHYGLFARMTTDRPELIFEATEDGTTWAAYDFFEKPGDPARGPRWCAPHMPRFDWMLWFAALSEDGELDGWVLRVAAGLMENRPETRALFRSAPFEGRPLAIRIVRARYLFATEGDDPWRIESRRVLRTFRRRD